MNSNWLCMIVGHKWRYRLVANGPGGAYPPMIEQRACLRCGASIKMWPPPMPTPPKPRIQQETIL